MIDDSSPADFKGREILNKYILQTRNPPPLGVTASPTYKLGIAWSTYFAHSVRRMLWSLRFAYRAPSFFAAEMAQQKVRHPLEFLTFDDSLRADQLDGTQARILEDVDIMYLSTHGSCSKGQYRVYLHANDWMPTQSGLGQRGPAAVIFDTCDLVDLTDPVWPAPWQTNNIGPALRLVLGFASSADVSEKPSQRGAGFAKEIIAGLPLAEAWLKAVHQTSVHHQSCDYGIAIALGDDQNDAQNVLNSAGLGSWPGPRSGSQIHVAWRCCH